MLLTHPFTALLAPLASYSWRGVVFALFFVALPVSAEERPDSFATLAEELSPSVVNISTSTLVRRDNNDDLEFPPDSPFKDFFDEFLDRNNRPSTPRPWVRIFGVRGWLCGDQSPCYQWCG